jgi:hypothetical protein
MEIQQHICIKGTWSEIASSGIRNKERTNLVLVFGNAALLTQPANFNFLRNMYPNADLVFASTAGEIAEGKVIDNSIIATAIAFDKTRTRSISVALGDDCNSYEAGQRLFEQLQEDDLCYMFVVSDGININGSELVSGLNTGNLKNVPITGGLAGDEDKFKSTVTGVNCIPGEGNVVGVGFYGQDLLIGHGSVGGWDEFGYERTITKSHKNILYQIDGKSALSLYKEYLGDYVRELPGSALLFPLSIKNSGSAMSLVRTILAINEEEDSMTFAGNMPEGSKVRLMKGNFGKLIQAATEASEISVTKFNESEPDLVILISCVGRKIILQNRIDEEIEATSEVFGPNVNIAGFYSYGEITPLNPDTKCELHNQTMTITTFKEL